MNKSGDHRDLHQRDRPEKYWGLYLIVSRVHSTDVTEILLPGYGAYCLHGKYGIYWWGEGKRSRNIYMHFANSSSLWLYQYATATTGTDDLELPALLISGERWGSYCEKYLFACLIYNALNLSALLQMMLFGNTANLWRSPTLNRTGYIS